MVGGARLFAGAHLLEETWPTPNKIPIEAHFQYHRHGELWQFRAGMCSHYFPSLL